MTDANLEADQFQTEYQSMPIEMLIDPPDGTVAPRKFTGIVQHTTYQLQPFTVWVRGETVKFFEHEDRAKQSFVSRIRPPEETKDTAGSREEQTPIKSDDLIPSEAVQDWVEKHVDEVVEVAEELSEGGPIDDVPVSEIVEFGLGVEHEEPRFDEITAATNKVLDKESKKRRGKRRGGRTQLQDASEGPVELAETPLESRKEEEKLRDRPARGFSANQGRYRNRRKRSCQGRDAYGRAFSRGVTSRHFLEE